jgi:hypothetical protein
MMHGTERWMKEMLESNKKLTRIDVSWLPTETVAGNVFLGKHKCD